LQGLTTPDAREELVGELMTTDNTPEENEENIEKLEQDDTSNNSPSRHNRRWSFEEENEIIEKLRKGMSWDQIARAHSRTIRAVQIRYAKACEHAETLEIVRGIATEEGTSRSPKDPNSEPNMDSGVEIPRMTRFDVISEYGELWYSFYMPEGE